MVSVNIDEIRQIINKKPKERTYGLAILQDISHKFNYIPKESLPLLAEHIEVELSELYSIVTFYKSLSLTPKGKNIIKVCDGTACHIRGSVKLIDGINERLGIKPGETTEDGLFSLETVNCLGACALAPAMVIGEIYYGKVYTAELNDIIRGYEKGGESHE